MDISNPRCIWRCALWAAVGFLFGALFSRAFACDYTPDPVSVPPKIEVTAL